MVYVTLTRKEIELLADCRHITLRDAIGERQLDTDHPAWNGLVGAACDSTYLLDVIRELKAEIERLIQQLSRVQADVELWAVTVRHRTCTCSACEDLRDIAEAAGGE